ncbi:polyprenyl synthetase family protein [Nannocystaceae bacterium ST9]
MEVIDYMRACQSAVLDEIRKVIPSDSRARAQLYDLVLDYPLRPAKGIRPALCIATCRALGGRLESVLPSAATLELYHNAFLVHDDVEDESERRRDRATLHHEHGVAVAVNVGDAMLALSLQPLLDNMAVIGLGRAIHVLQLVARMARETAEGQAVELAWIRSNDWAHEDRDYVRMVYQKTAWYTFVAPMQIGAIVAGASDAQLRALGHVAVLLGIAFQIQDDLLNLEGNETAYGKEIGGDLWEGKHTLILTHALRTATPAEREQALQILAKRRPLRRELDALEALRRELHELADQGHLSEHAGRCLAAHHERQQYLTKTEDDIRFLVDLIQRRGSLAHARDHARRRARKAGALLDACGTWLPDSTHRRFIEDIVAFVTQRTN